MRTKKPIICIMGAALDTGNMGVSALSASLINLFLKYYPNAEIYLFIGNKSSQSQELLFEGERIKINILNFRFSPKASLNEHILVILFFAILQRIVLFKKLRKRIIKKNRCLATIDKADFVGDIWGGDSFSDIYGLRAFITASLTHFVVCLLNKKLILLPQTYGPFKSAFSKRIAKRILSCAHIIYSRDQEAQSKLALLFPQQRLITKKVQYCPDVAFTLPALTPPMIKTQPDFDKKHSDFIIGFNISGLLTTDSFNPVSKFGIRFNYHDFVVSVIKLLLLNENSKILLIPHTFTSNTGEQGDNVACKTIFEEVKHKYPKRIYFINGQYDQHQIKGIIGCCDLVIASRMHACIAALSQKIPTIGIAYSHKFEGIFKSVGMADWLIDARNRDLNHTIRSLEILLSKHSIAKKQLQQVIDDVQTQINITFSKMILPNKNDSDSINPTNLTVVEKRYTKSNA